MAKKDFPAERVGDVLGKSLSRLDLAARLDEYGVWPIWNDVVGKIVARNAQPEKIRNGTLFVKVTSPVWMQQLQYMKEMISEKLNQRLRAEVVKNIFFIVGRIETGGAEDETPPPRKDSESDGTQLDDRFLESVSDPEIRQAFRRLLRSYAKRNPKA